MTSKTALPFEGPSIPHHWPWKGKDGRMEALALSPDNKTTACESQQEALSDEIQTER